MAASLRSMGGAVFNRMVEDGEAGYASIRLSVRAGEKIVGDVIEPQAYDRDRAVEERGLSRIWPSCKPLATTPTAATCRS